MMNSNSAAENSLSREAMIAKSKFQVKLDLFFLLVHTVCYWPLKTYSFELFAFMFVTTGFVACTSWIEIHNRERGQALKAMLFGILPASLMAAKPDYAIFATFSHFFAMNMAFYDTDLSKLPHLMITNILAWITSYFFLMYRRDDYLGAQEIRYLWANFHRFSQLLMGYGMNYAITVFLARNKVAEAKMHETYQAKLLSLNKELETANLKLQKANGELQDALQEKENFILRFSHEIRNPLNSLLGNVELCYEKAQDHELKTMLQDAKVSGEILLQLLNNVLDTAKVAVGRLELSVNSQNFRRFLERAWVICSEIIRKKGLTGFLYVNHDVPESLDFDHHRLMQILINTISNATKFTESGFVKVYIDFEVGAEIKQNDMKTRHKRFICEGGSELSVAEEMIEKPRNNYECLAMQQRRFRKERLTTSEYPSEQTIQIPYTFTNMLIGQKTTLSGIKGSRNHVQTTSEAIEGFIRLEIIDSGCGINKTDLDNLFQKFSQVNKDSSKRQVGTGLGLWITKEIIELMEGKIDIHSALNQGTALVIMIKSQSPHLSGKLSSIKPSIDLDSPRQKSIARQPADTVKRVLVVEDIPYNQELNQKFLEKCKVQEITIANNGQEALDIYTKTKEQHYFDLILMDIDMPIMDGKTATKKIREFEMESGWKPTSVVFLTAYAEAKTQSELLNPNGEYRANGFLSKPASLETIQRTLKEKANKKLKSMNNLRTSMTDQNQKVILIADDDPSNLVILSKMAALYGFKTLEARNGEMALELYERSWREVKLILMDCEMPVMDGFEATQRILLKYKKLADLMRREIRIYGLTGYVGKEYREKCLEAGMKDVLEKPITIDRLRSLLLDQKK